MRNTIVFVSWTSPIVLEWLHLCDSDFSAEFLNFGAGDLPFQFIFFVIENRVFFCLGSAIHPVLELQFLMRLRMVLLCFAMRYLEIAL